MKLNRSVQSSVACIVTGIKDTKLSVQFCSVGLCICQINCRIAFPERSTACDPSILSKLILGLKAQSTIQRYVNYLVIHKPLNQTHLISSSDKLQTTKY